MKLFLKQLEGELAMHLQYALRNRRPLERSIRARRWRQCAGDRTEGRRTNRAIGGRKVRLVEEVVSIRANRERHRLTVIDLLGQRHIRIHIVRSEQRVPAKIAKRRLRRFEVR